MGIRQCIIPAIMAYVSVYHNQDFTTSHYDIKDRQQITANE